MKKILIVISVFKRSSFSRATRSGANSNKDVLVHELQLASCETAQYCDRVCGHFRIQNNITQCHVPPPVAPPTTVVTVV